MDSFEHLLNLYGLRAAGLLLAVALLLPVALILWTMGSRWDATFSVSAQTEVLSFQTDKINVPNWFLSFNRLRIDGEDIDPGQMQLSIGHDARSTLRRLETGPLQLQIESMGSEKVTSLFSPADEPIIEVKRVLQALIAPPAGEPLTLPLAGQAVIGETVFAQTASTSPVLLDGEIEVFGLEFLGDNRFSANRAQLSPGDRLEILDHGNTASGHGLIRIESDAPGMRVIFHADGDAASIVRFGTAGYELSPSLWSRISSDPLFRNILAIYAALLPVLAIATTTILSQLKLKKITKIKMQSTIDEPVITNTAQDDVNQSLDEKPDLNQEQGNS